MAFRKLIVSLANLRAKAFGIPIATPEKILSIVDDIVPSASFTTSSIVALALSNLNMLDSTKSTIAFFNLKEYTEGEYKLIRYDDKLTLQYNKNPMLILPINDYNKFLKIRKKYFWFFINLANNHFTKLIAPEPEIWRPDKKCLFGKTRLGLTVWDSFNISNNEMTLSQLARCYEALFNVNIIGFIRLADDLEDTVLEVNDTKVKDIPNTLGLRPIAKLNNELIQLPDVIT